MSFLPSQGRSARNLVLAGLLTISAGPLAHADTFYWGGTTSSGTNPPVGGTATWATNTTRWTLMNYEGGGTPGYFLWTNGNTAVFGGTAGTVNIGNSYTVADFLVITNNYIFEIGATRTLTVTNFGGAGLTNSTFRPTTNASRTLVLDVAGSTELSGLLTDATNGTSLLSVTKQGVGTLTLARSNGLSGNFSVDAGVLLAGHNRAFGFSTVTIGAGGTLAGVNQSLTLSNAVFAAGSATVPSIFAGDTNITVVGKLSGAAGASRGVQNNISDGSVLTLGDVDISPDTNNARTIYLSGTGETVVSGVIANGNAVTTNSLTVVAAGTVTLASSNSYNGTTTVDSTNGILQIAHNNGFGSSTVVFNSGVLQAGAGARTLTNSFIIGGDVTMSGTNALTLNGTTTLNNTRDITNTSTAGINFGKVVIGTNSTNRTLIVKGAGDTTFSGEIANSASNNAASVDIWSSGLTALNASNSYSGNTIIRGSVDPTNIPGPVVRLGNSFALGAPSGTNTVNSGGQLDLNGQSIAGEDLRLTGSGFQEAGALVNSASGAAIWSGAISLLSAVKVATTNGRITVGGPITATNSGFTLSKSGTGTLTLAGTNTYTSDTAVSAGRLELATNGTLLFVIQTNGVNNAVTGAGSATFHGTFNFDLSAASTNSGDSWTVVSVGSPTYGTNFLVSGFNTSGGGLWTRVTNTVTYQFSQSSGVLSVAGAPPASTYSNWLTNYPSLSGTNTSPAADPESDGFNNGMEFAFDGDPTIGTPALLRAAKSGTNVVFNFVGRTDSLTNYVVLSTTNLSTGPWGANSVTVTNSADQSGVLLPGEYVRREFVVPGTNTGFYRIKALLTIP